MTRDQPIDQRRQLSAPGHRRGILAVLQLFCCPGTVFRVGAGLRPLNRLVANFGSTRSTCLVLALHVAEKAECAEKCALSFGRPEYRCAEAGWASIKSRQFIDGPVSRRTLAAASRALSFWSRRAGVVLALRPGTAGSNKETARPTKNSKRLRRPRHYYVKTWILW
jgi:hypothetical protein